MALVLFPGHPDIFGLPAMGFATCQVIFPSMCGYNCGNLAGSTLNDYEKKIPNKKEVKY